MLDYDEEKKEMGKHPVRPNWFLELQNPHDNLKWLSQVSASVEIIANFGCTSSEFLALLWRLDAAEVKVVEREEKHRNKQPMGPRKELEFVGKKIPAALEGRSVEFIVADMSKLREDELASDYCDLTYCEEVLYFMMSDLQEVRDSISQMARIVRPGGWVIAVELHLSENIDREKIGRLFEAAGLRKYGLDGAPSFSYCYKKPHDETAATWRS